MGDFNIDLLKYDSGKDSADFQDPMHAKFLLSWIRTTSRVTIRSKTLIDNIFSDNIEDGSAVYREILQEQSSITTLSFFYCESEIYHQDFKKLKNNLVRDQVNTNWDAILQVNNGGVDKFFESFITTVNSIIFKE